MVDSVRRTLGQSVVYASNGSVLDLLHFPFIPLTSSVPRAIEFAKQMEALAKETSAALTFAAEANKTIRPKAPSGGGIIGRGSSPAGSERFGGDKTIKKAGRQRYGPFQITERIGIQDYRLQYWKIHTPKLTPYIAPKFPSQTDPISISVSFLFPCT